VIRGDVAVLAAVLLLAGIASYIRDTLRGRVQPNRVSYSLWAAAPMIAFAVELKAGISPKVALVTFALGAGPALAVLATFARRKPDPDEEAADHTQGHDGGAGAGPWRLTYWDYACGGCGVLALVLWVLTGRGTVAIALTIAAELSAGLPTITKTWAHPESETVGTYACSGAGAGITVLAAGHLGSPAAPSP
jgi:hypothetical protein